MAGKRGANVYRFYDEDGLLLYVGMTARGFRRTVEHGEKQWWDFVKTQTVDHYDTRQHAADMERALIRETTPPFNVQHNPNHESLKAAYLARRAAGGGRASRPLALDLAESLDYWVPLEMLQGEGFLTLRVGLQYQLITGEWQVNDAPVQDVSGSVIGYVSESGHNNKRLFDAVMDDYSQVAVSAQARITVAWAGPPVVFRMQFLQVTLRQVREGTAA